MVLAVRRRHAMSMETKSGPNPDVCYGVLVRKLAAAACAQPGKGSILRARSSGPATDTSPPR